MHPKPDHLALGLSQLTVILWHAYDPLGDTQTTDMCSVQSAPPPLSLLGMLTSSLRGLSQPGGPSVQLPCWITGVWRLHLIGHLRLSALTKYHPVETSQSNVTRFLNLFSRKHKGLNVHPFWKLQLFLVIPACGKVEAEVQGGSQGGGPGLHKTLSLTTKPGGWREGSVPVTFQRSKTA